MKGAWVDAQLDRHIRGQQRLCVRDVLVDKQIERSHIDVRGRESRQLGSTRRRCVRGDVLAASIVREVGAPSGEVGGAVPDPRVDRSPGCCGSCCDRRASGRPATGSTPRPRRGHGRSTPARLPARRPALPPPIAIRLRSRPSSSADDASQLQPGVAVLDWRRETDARAPGDTQRTRRSTFSSLAMPAQYGSFIWTLPTTIPPPCIQ